jgi:DNA-binding beta-propeller fold protein YncE
MLQPLLHALFQSGLKGRVISAVLVAVAILALCGSASGAGSPLPLREVALLPLPGPANRFDYQSYDPTTHLLWIAHMNAGELLAYDVRRHKVVATIPAPGVHGVIAVPSAGRVYATATDAQRALTIDSRTGKVLASAPAVGYPDGLAYDPVEKRVFITDEERGIETVLDQRGRLVGTIPVGGQGGNVQYDAGSGRVLVAVQSRDDIAVIDPRTDRVVRRISLAGCANDHGLYVDSDRRLAFVACDQNAVLLTLDLRTITVTGRASIGQAPDVLAFDPVLHRLYVSSESGTISVFAETAHGLRKLGEDFLASEAHTVAVDPDTHLVYFPLQGPNGKPHLLVMRPI